MHQSGSRNNNIDNNNAAIGKQVDQCNNNNNDNNDAAIGKQVDQCNNNDNDNNNAIIQPIAIKK